MVQTPITHATLSQEIFLQAGVDSSEPLTLLLNSVAVNGSVSLELGSDSLVASPTTVTVTAGSIESSEFSLTAREGTVSNTILYITYP